MSREPSVVPFIEEGPGDVGIARLFCPVKDCAAWAARGVKLTCEHEYPGRCSTCCIVVGDRYEELTWMGPRGWICARCRSYCEECEAEGLITFCGVCASCLEVVNSDKTVLWPPLRQVVQVRLVDIVGGGYGNWERLDR